MKTLLILRHAKSSWKNLSLSDHERPLNKRGKRDAPRLGKLLAKNDLIPDLIVTSSAKRALTTAKMVAASSGYKQEIMVTRHLYNADPGDYLAVLREKGGAHDCVMVVGHNPGIEILVEDLVGEHKRMPTAAVAHVVLPVTKWAELSPETTGRLLNFWCPQTLNQE